jgi:hypothetical protein
MSVVYQGEVAPAAVVFNLVPGSTGIDLSTVTAVTIYAAEPGGTIHTWTTVLTNQTTTTLTASHPFASDGSDLPTPGEWGVYANLTIPSGHLRVPAQLMPVKAPFEP